MDKNFTRLLDLLNLLGDTPASATQLQARLAILGHITTKRTVERDLLGLASTYPIDCDDRSKPYGWRWRAGAPRIGSTSMDLNQALSFYLMAQHLSPLMPEAVSQPLKPYFLAATERIERGIDAAPIKQWPKRIHVVQPEQPLRSPKVLPAVRSAIMQALLEGKQLTLSYNTQRKPAPVDALSAPVHPLGVVQHGRALYLAVRFYDYPDVRMVALHRVRKALLLDSPAQFPTGFNLATWAQQAFGFGAMDASAATIALQAEFYGSAAMHLVESPLSTDQQAEPIEGGIRLSATVTYDRRFLWWLRGFGADVRVLAPANLVTKLKTDLQAALAGYALSA
jgi:predicted DNA-binding transcriptional regulator YafY